MFSLKESIFGKKVEEAKELEIKIEEPEEEEPSSEEETKESSREELMEEIHEALEDLSDDELDIVLDTLYSILLQDDDGSEDKEELEESFIDHLSSTEKSQMKMKRRLPKWKRKAKIRYFRNKKCPAGTSWSSVDKSCTHINIDMSRLQKIISKMKIRSK